MSSPEGESRCRLFSPWPPWRSSWCWHHCSRESLERIDVGITKQLLFKFVKYLKHNILMRLDQVSGDLWITCRKHAQCENEKQRGGFEFVCRVFVGGKFCNTCKSFVLRCNKKKGEGLFSITVSCFTYVFATEPSRNCSWRKRRCRMCLRAAPRKIKNLWIQLENTHTTNYHAGGKWILHTFNQKPRLKLFYTSWNIYKSKQQGFSTHSGWKLNDWSHICL